MNVPEQFADLPGTFEIDSTVDMFSDRVAIRIIQRLPAIPGFPAKKIGGMVIASREMLTDTAIDLAGYIGNSLDHIFLPWVYPDEPVVWEFDLFPRWTRLCNLGQRAKGWFAR